MHSKNPKFFIIRFVLILIMLWGMIGSGEAHAAPLGIGSTVSVTVLDTDGTPAAGLNVYAFNNTTYTGIHGVTDQNGQISLELPDGAYRFRADLNGTQFWSGTANHCNVPGCTDASITVSKPVTVTVLDTDGTPKTGLNVYAFNGSTYIGYSKTTNSEGQAIFTLPLGSYRFRADLNGTQFWSAASNHCDIPGCSNSAITVSKPMTVTILDTDGMPKSGLNVYAFNGSIYTGYNKTTNASGQANFTLPLGSYRFRADLNGTQFWSDTANHCAIPDCDSAGVVVSKPITVTVLDTDDTPKSNLNVYAFNGSTYMGYNKTTNASGQAVFTLPLGNYRFRADLNGVQFWSGTANHCSLPGCESSAVTVTIPVTVAIRDAGGVSQPGVNVYAFNGSSYTGYSKVSDAYGQAVFTLPLGSYRFRADYSGVQYWSDAANHCSLPGCLDTTVTVGPAMTATPISTYTPTATQTPTSTPTNTPTFTPTSTSLPITRVVTNTNASGSGSLFQAMNESNSGDTITFAPALAGRTITLSSGIAINGKKLILDGSGLSPQVTIDGAGTNGFYLNGPSSLDIYDLTISNFSNTLFFRRDAIIRNSTLRGFRNDILFVYGSLTVLNSTLEDSDGRAISAYGPITITNSILRGNGNDAISGSGPMTVIGSTVMGNQGRGIVANGASLSLVNSTIYQNAEEAIMINGGDESTVVNSTIARNQGEMGQIFVNGLGDVDISNSIIVGTTNRVFFINSSTLNLHNSMLVCTHDNECFSSTQGTVNWFDSSVLEGATWEELRLGEPADNGGSTPTMALAPDSFLINAGDDAICANAPVNNLDQRGVERPQGTHCDIGAYEYKGSTTPKTATVTTLITSPNPSMQGQLVAVSVRVSSVENELPTGTVNVSVSGNTTCTITLVNGTGICDIVFSTVGMIPVTAMYNGDSEHLPSSATSAHEVLGSTAIPSFTPYPTLTYTPTVTPTITSTPVVGCSNITVPTGQTIVVTAKTMYLNIYNPMSYDVTIGDVFVRWNYLKGHVPGDSNLRLLSAQLNSPLGTNIFWTGDVHAPSYAISPSTPVVVPANQTASIIFTFDKTYTRLDGEQIQITFSTPGCENHVINVVR